MLICILGKAQTAFTVKYVGLTIHPFGDNTAHLQPNKLDPEAKFVLNYGLFVGYEKFVHEDLISLKFIQGGLADCSNGFASVSHFGVRVKAFDIGKHKLYGAIGPTFIIRDSWTRFGPSYEGSGFFNVSHNALFGDVQWKFIPYGMELEYDYELSPKNLISLSVTPGIPLASIISLGWKHYITLEDYGEFKLFKP